MPSRLLSAAIVVFWLAMMLSLVKDKILPKATAQRTTEVDVPALVVEWEDVDDWFRVVNDGRQIGAMRLGIQEWDRPVGFRADVNFVIQLNVLRRTLRIDARGAALLDTRFFLHAFTVELDAWNLRLTAAGRVTDDLQLRTQFQLGDEPPERFVLQLEREISFLEAIRPIALKRLELQIGQSFLIPVIDPIYQMKRGNLNLTVEGYDLIELSDNPQETVTALRVSSTFGALTTYLWLTREGEILKRQLVPRRDIYLERTSRDGLRRGDQGVRFAETINRPIDLIELLPEDFDGIEVHGIDEVYNVEAFAGIFESLNIVPETSR